MRRVNWSDGVEVNFEDLNKGQETLLELVSDGVLHALGNRGVSGACLRPLRDAACVAASDTDEVDLAPGLVMYEPATAKVVDTLLRPVAYYPGGTIAFDAPTAATYRRDVIEARVVLSDAATVTRDVQDGTTRVITAESVVMRKFYELEVQVVKGTDQVSAILADANEPATTSGWFKLHSVRIDDGVAAPALDLVRDYRLPLGFWGTDIYPAIDGAASEASGARFFAASDSGGRLVVDGGGGSTAVLSIPLLRARQMNLSRVGHVRLAKLVMGIITGMDVGEIQRFTLTNGLNDAVVVKDVSATVATTGEKTLFDAPATDTVPLWSNGYANPTVGPATTLGLRFESNDDLNVVGHYGYVQAWGGL